MEKLRKWFSPLQSLDRRIESALCTLQREHQPGRHLRKLRNMKSMVKLPNYPLGYGLVEGAYGTLPPAYAQPMAYGRTVPNPGVAMVPMILPDGHLKYVLQQPGPSAAVHLRGCGRNAASSGGGGRKTK